MPDFFPAATAAFRIFSIAALSSSSGSPVVMGWCRLLPRSYGPTKSTSMPSTFAIASTCPREAQRQSTLPPVNSIKALTFSKASLVSICTIVTNASFACCIYSKPDGSPNAPIENGLP